MTFFQNFGFIRVSAYKGVGALLEVEPDSEESV